MPSTPTERHTAIPWHHEQKDKRGAWIGGSTWAALSCGETDEQAEANAHFIVTAVNAHDELVAALELAEDVLSRPPYSNGMWPNGMHPQTGITQIRAALAKVS
jgi:hypothetical protein